MGQGAIKGMFRCAPLFVGAALVSLISGCSSLVAGPQSSFDIKNDIKGLEAQYLAATSVHEYYSVKPETKERRDEFISGRLALYNLSYIQYISQFSLSSAEMDSAFDIAKLTTDLSITVGGTLQSKAVLGAFSGLLTGTKTSIDKNFFEQKTTQALVAEMNAQRKAALVPILAGMNEDVLKYPMATALVDLQNFYEAGTLQGAWQGIQSDAGAKDAAASIDINKYRNIKFSSDKATGDLQNWIWPGLKSFSAAGVALDSASKAITPNTDNLKALHAWMQQNNLDSLATEAFLVGPDFAALRQNAVKYLIK